MPRGDITKFNESLTPEERIEHARQAGKQSAKKRREYSSQRKLIRQILSTEVVKSGDTKAIIDLLEQAGLPNTYGAAVAMAVTSKAGAGDVEAARYLRDTVGEKPTDTYNLGISDKPVKAIDLTQLTDDELEALADRGE